MRQDREYVALVSRWNRKWDIFLLDPVEGFIGSAVAATKGEIEVVARRLLDQHRPEERRTARIEIIYSSSTWTGDAR
jgi:hypothetical protein